MDVCCREREEFLDYTNVSLAYNDSEPECPSYFEAWQRKCYHFSPSVDQSGALLYLTWSQAKVRLN